MGRPKGSKNKTPAQRALELKNKRPAHRPVEWTEEAAMALASALEAWMEEDEEHIFFQEYLAKHRIRNATIANLSSKYPEFQKIIKDLKVIQEYRINRLALKQKINPVMAIFLLKNHHGYTDKQEIKTENLNYNYDPGDLRQKTQEQLQDLLNLETNTTQ